MVVMEYAKFCFSTPYGYCSVDGASEQHIHATNLLKLENPEGITHSVLQWH